MGLTVGALLGLLVPKSEQEETALGDVASEAQNAVQDLMGRGGRVAGKMAEQVWASARTHGFETDKPVEDRADDVQSGEAAGHEFAQDVPQSGEEALRRKWGSTPLRQSGHLPRIIESLTCNLIDAPFSSSGGNY
jgi:hypothetical protein